MTKATECDESYLNFKSKQNKTKSSIFTFLSVLTISVVVKVHVALCSWVRCAVTQRGYREVEWFKFTPDPALTTSGLNSVTLLVYLPPLFCSPPHQTTFVLPPEASSTHR